MKYVFPAAFALFTAVHLYASARRDVRLRNLTKPFLILTLLGFYLCAARSVRTAVVLALVFSWLGDVLLMPKGVKWFTAGGIAFMISHAFFVAGYLPDISFAVIPVWAVAALAVFFIATVTLIFSRLKPHLPKALFYPMFLYLLINGTMNCFAVFRLLTMKSLPALVTCIGAVLFFISDSSLFFVRFKKDGRLKTHFVVMLTYAVGELLIIIGLL